MAGEENLTMHRKAAAGFTRAKQWEEMRLHKLSSVMPSPLSGYFPCVLFGHQIRHDYSISPNGAPHI